MALNTYFFMLTSIYVTSATLIKECPPKESTTCFCSNFAGIVLNINCRTISSQKSLESNLEALKGYSIYSLTLEGVNASTLPTSLFQGLHVRDLTLHLLEVDDASSAGLDFSGLEKSLERLRISASFKRTGPLSSLKLDHLHSLKEVLLNELQIYEIGNDWFKGPKSLETFAASRSGIEQLGDKVFASLTNLQALDFHNNHLKEISRSMLPLPANHLDHLEITRNKIRTLPSDIFSDMPALKNVHIGHNLIHALPEDTWSPVLSNLEYVELRGNPLQCDQDLKWVCDQSSYSIATSFECASPVDKKGLSVYQFCKMQNFNIFVPTMSKHILSKIDS